VEWSLSCSSGACAGVCLALGTLWAANDPFVGKWKVNPSKSKLIDEMRVEAAGENRYTFTFGPGQVDTVVADGSDQPALSGTTLSITVKGPNNWEVVRKMKGRTLLRAQWTLSEDGKTMNDAFTQYLPDGATLFFNLCPLVRHWSCPMCMSDGGNQVFGTWDRERDSEGGKRGDPALRGRRPSFKRSDQETAKRI
jgi:hypothetical protein